MKNKCFNKSLLTLVTVVMIAMLAFAFTACNKKPVVQTDTEIVITVTKALYENGDTLQSYMDKLVEKGKLTYSTENGMLTAINGVEAKAINNEYWLIYTSDTEFSNTSWGTYNYDGTEYGSATLGIASLKVKEGEIYIFAISKF